MNLRADTRIPAPRLRMVPPRDVDPSAADWLQPHVVTTPTAAPPVGRLLLFLSGSFGIPRPRMAFVTQAARLGLHAINLRYPNRWTVGGRCRRSPDPDAHAKVRTAIITGEPCTDLVHLLPQDAIVPRLTRLLIWLTSRHPTEGWDRFLQSGQPRWESIVVAGHSQGGGHAGMMSKLYPMARAIMLASPADHVRTLSAPWLERPGATPASRLFGFVHAHDPQAAHILAAWERMGLGASGPVVNVDVEGAALHGARRLVTSTAVRSACCGVWPPLRANRYHASVAIALATPARPDRTPRFTPVWSYLLTGGTDA